MAIILAAAGAGTGDGRQIDATVNLVSDLDQFEQHTIAEITDSAAEFDKAVSSAAPHSAAVTTIAASVSRAGILRSRSSTCQCLDDRGEALWVPDDEVADA